MKRLFLITKKFNKENIILGYVTSSNYPSRIANDQDYAREKFGYDYLTVTEVTKKCYIEL